MSEGVGKQLGQFLGEFLEYDAGNSSACWRSYMRIRVRIDVWYPLKRWKKVRNGQGESIMLLFKYERLVTFCYICGLLGHSEKYRDLLFSRKAEELRRDWGLELRAPPRRSTGFHGELWLREPGVILGEERGGLSASRDSVRAPSLSFPYQGMQLSPTDLDKHRISENQNIYLAYRKNWSWLCKI